MKNQKLRIYLHINNYMYPLCWNIFEHHLLDIFHPRVARLVPLSSRIPYSPAAKSWIVHFFQKHCVCH